MSKEEKKEDWSPKEVSLVWRYIYFLGKFPAPFLFYKYSNICCKNVKYLSVNLSILLSPSLCQLLPLFAGLS